MDVIKVSPEPFPGMPKANTVKHTYKKVIYTSHFIKAVLIKQKVILKLIIHSQTWWSVSATTKITVEIQLHSNCGRDE